MTYVEKQAEEYIESVIDDYDLDIDGKPWRVRVTGRLTRHRANIRQKNDGSYLIKLSKHVVQDEGWESLKGALRHEVAHMVTFINHGDHSEKDFRFQQKLRELDAPTQSDAPASNPNYILRCNNCRNKVTRHQKSKVIKKYERYSCSDCGGSFTRIK